MRPVESKVGAFGVILCDGRGTGQNSSGFSLKDDKERMDRKASLSGENLVPIEAPSACAVFWQLMGEASNYEEVKLMLLIGGS